FSFSPSSLSFFYISLDHRDLHSFPTRRSSDLSIGRSLTPKESLWKDLILLYLVVWIFLAQRVTQPNSVRQNWIYLPSSFALITGDRKSTRLNSSHVKISYAVFCLKKKKK